MKETDREKEKTGNCSVEMQQGCKMTLIHKQLIFAGEKNMKKLSLKIFIKLWSIGVNGRSVLGNYPLLFYHIFIGFFSIHDGVKVGQELTF